MLKITHSIENGVNKAKQMGEGSEFTYRFYFIPGITLSNDARTITLAANAASVSVAPGINMIQICVYVYMYMYIKISSSIDDS